MPARFFSNFWLGPRGHAAVQFVRGRTIVKRIQYDRYGGPETMRIEDFDLAEPEAGQVAIKVKFASVNPIDWKLRRGDLKIMTGKSFPRAMGSDFSGTVLAVGPGVTRFKPGDAVFGLSRLKESGSLGEAVITNGSFVAKKPEALSFEQAACLGTPGVMAWQGLIDSAHVKAGQRVFVNGCTGAVGQAVVQLARALGASVSGSCNADSIERARSLGVDPVYDYASIDLPAIGERFDIVYDTAGGLLATYGLQLLRGRGLFLDINASPGKFLRALLNRRLKLLICKPNPEILDGVARLAANGSIRMAIGQTVPLTQAIKLIGDLEGGRKIAGKALVAAG